MSNILFTYCNEEPTAIMGLNMFRKAAESRGGSCRGVPADRISSGDILWSDVCIFVRSQSVIEAQLIRLAKKLDKVCALIIDDDFFSIKDYAVRRSIQKKSLETVISYSDYIISSNGSLLNKINAMNPRARVVMIDNMVAENEIYEREHEEKDEIKIVYYVNDGSTEDFDAIIRPLMPLLYKKYGHNIKWYFMSLHPEFGSEEYARDIVYVDRMSLSEFKKFLGSEGFDIGIAPLMANDFTKCKYINKFVEYTCAGIPAIYSKVSPYAEFIRNDENGILCANAEEWMSAFDTMMDASKRNSITRAAQRIIRCEFAEEKIIEKLVVSMPEIGLGEIIGKNAITSIKLYLLWSHVRNKAGRILDIVLRIYYRWKLEGMKSVIDWAWRHYIVKKK